MPYSYSKKTIYQTHILEVLAVIILSPLIWVARLRKKTSVKKILLIEPFQMGDVLSLTPMIAPLKNKFSEAKIYVLTKPGSGSILDFDLRISSVIKMDFPWSDYEVKSNQLSRIMNLSKQLFFLRKEKFDLAIDTRGDIRSQIIMLWIGAFKRVGYLNYLHSNVNIYGLLLTDFLKQGRHHHRYEWNLELLTMCGFSIDELYPIQFPSFLPTVRPGSSNTKSIVIHIGGGWKYKRWKVSRWVKLIEILLTRNEEITVIGGQGEKDLLQQVQSMVQTNPKLCFKTTSLEEMIATLNSCKIFIGLDSGPMNLATCLNKKVIALFGPGDSEMWYPLTLDSKHLHKKEKYPCNPCFQTTCYYPNHNCMDEITVDDVMELVADA